MLGAVLYYLREISRHCHLQKTVRKIAGTPTAFLLLAMIAVRPFLVQPHVFFFSHALSSLHPQPSLTVDARYARPARSRRCPQSTAHEDLSDRLSSRRHSFEGGAAIQEWDTTHGQHGADIVSMLASLTPIFALFLFSFLLFF